MPHWAVQQIRVLIAPNSQIVMFITVAIDFLVQPKGHAAHRALRRLQGRCHFECGRQSADRGSCRFAG
jgi:hypothetical protein